MIKKRSPAPVMPEAKEAPFLHVPDFASIGFIVGKVIGGGVVVNSHADAVALAEQLLDWAWGKPETSTNNWPYEGRRVRRKSHPGWIRDVKRSSRGLIGRYDLEISPDATDYDGPKQFGASNSLWETVLANYEVIP